MVEGNDRLRLSVVIPNWNGARHLAGCLTALGRQGRQAEEIIVVDNGSTDGSPTLVQQHFPAVRLIVNERNLGFAQATNQGILAAAGTVIVLLNNDTEPAPECLAALVAPLAADASLGATAATLVFADRPERVNAAGLTIGRDLVADDGWLGEPVARLPAAPWPVFGPSGGAAALRRAALDDVGLFDVRFFAYLEDVDLAWRLRLGGWATVAVPAARVAHHYSATAGADSPFKRYHLARNRIWYLVKNIPLSLWRRHLAAQLWYDTAALLAAIAGGDRAWLRGRRDGLVGIPGLLAERRAIQQRRRSSPTALEALLGPRVGPLGTWRRRRLVQGMAGTRHD
jgi:GT2 family glycosyltransferase